MGRRNTFDKINIELDLTSLLDVIFIVLMVVLCSSYNNDHKIGELQKALDDANGKAGMYEDHGDDIEHLDERVVFLTIRADFYTEDPTHRTVRIMTNDDYNGAEQIDITPEDEEEKYSAIKDKIATVLDSTSETSAEKTETIPVWVTLSDENILYRDWVEFDDMLGVLKESYPNLYVYDRLMNK